MEQCVTIFNVKDVLPNRVWNHGPVKMYPKDHIRKVFIDVIILSLILVMTRFICGMQSLDNHLRGKRYQRHLGPYGNQRASLQSP